MSSLLMPSTFHPFTRLPRELQDATWDLAGQMHRVNHTFHTDKDIPYADLDGRAFFDVGLTTPDINLKSISHCILDRSKHRKTFETGVQWVRRCGRRLENVVLSPGRSVMEELDLDTDIFTVNANAMERTDCDNLDERLLNALRKARTIRIICRANNLRSTLQVGSNVQGGAWVDREAESITLLVACVPPAYIPSEATPVEEDDLDKVEVEARKLTKKCVRGPRAGIDGAPAERPRAPPGACVRIMMGPGLPAKFMGRMGVEWTLEGEGRRYEGSSEAENSRRRDFEHVGALQAGHGSGA